MHEETRASHQPGELQGSGKGVIEQDAQEPCATQSSKNASFGEGLKVVVMRVIDALSIVERFVRGINDLERAESRSGDGMIEENLPSVPAHGGPLPGGGFQGLERRKALQELSDAQPGNHKQR